MPVTNLGTLLINRALPERLRKDSHELDKKGIATLFKQLAEEHPEQYGDIYKNLLDVGRKAAYQEGVTVSLGALSKSQAKQKLLAPVLANVAKAIDDDSLDDKTRNEKIIELMQANGLGDKLKQQVFEEAKAENNPYAQQIVAGARGDEASLNSLRGAELLGADHRGRLIPIPMVNSYAEGLDPVEFWIGTYGQRRNQAATKLSTAAAGYLAKQLVQAAHRTVVNKERPDDTRVPVGLPVETLDQDNVGAVLVRPTGGLPAGHLLRAEDLRMLHDAGDDEIVVHSPMTEVTADGGISRFAAGRRTRGSLSPIGDNIGIAAAQALSEKLSQGTLNCLAAGTLVAMADGTSKAIELIEIGDQVMGSDVYGVIRPTLVTNKFDQGMQPARRWILRDTDTWEDVELIATDEHKVLGHFTAPSVGTVIEITQQNAAYTLAPIGTSAQIVTLYRAARGRDLGEVRNPRHQFFRQFDRSAGGEGVSIPPRHDDPRSAPNVRTVTLMLLVGVGEAQFRPCWDIEVDNHDHLFVLASGLVVSNSKHSSLGAKTKRERSGMDFINRLLQAPEHFPEAGPLAEDDGVVDEVKPEPQGGFKITVGPKDYYLHPEITPTVKPGDRISRGSDLSDGIPHPRDLVRLRGLGEARREYTGLLTKAMRASGFTTHRRNVEAIVGGLLGWAKVTGDDGAGDFLPDDIAPYNSLAASYERRPDARLVPVDQAANQYLEEPALHHTIGTQLAKPQLAQLKRHGVKDLWVHQEAPAWEPHYQRAVMAVHDDPDWQTRLSGFYSADAMRKALWRGLDSDANSTSFVPALAKAQDFGADLAGSGTYGAAPKPPAAY